jgi:hypothetical protein
MVTRPTTLEEAGFKRNCGVLINEKIYIVKKLLSMPKHDWLLVVDEDGHKFKALLNTCQRIDAEILI